MIHKARIWLIRLGKVLPFVICFIVMLSYSETAFNLATNDLFSWCGIAIPSKPISWFISGYFEYNLQMLVVLVILSISIQTCVYNKLACAYLGINLAEKSYFDFELEPTIIYIICIANIIAAGYLTVKGITIFLKSAK